MTGSQRVNGEMILKSDGEKILLREGGQDRKE